MKYVKLWLKTRRKRHRGIVVKAIEKSLTKCVLDRLITKWKGRMECIQRLFHMAIFFRISLYESLLSKWNKAEFEIFEKSPNKTHRRRRAISLSNIQQDRSIEGCTSIPTEIKIYYLKKYIKTRMKLFISEYRVYKAHFKSIHRQNIKNRFVLENDNILDYPMPPEKPNLYEELTLSKLEELIFCALKDKDDWQGILIAQANRRSKSFKK